MNLYMYILLINELIKVYHTKYNSTYASKQTNEEKGERKACHK